MKHIIILGDGMADWPVESLGGKTLMQYAKTPYMDKLASMGRTGRLKTVADGFHPGSEVANMSVLGYDLPKVYEGRGPLEAASIGVDLKPGEMAMRCNIICIEGDHIKNHSAGHITTEEADVLVKYLQEHLGNERVCFYTGVQYRHLLVIKGGDKRIDCTPPHDVPLKPFRPLLVKPMPGTENITVPEGSAELIDYEYPTDGKNPIGRMYNAKLTKAEATANVKAFCAAVKKAGYTPLVYANKSDLSSLINGKTIGNTYKVWLANYPSRTS